MTEFTFITGLDPGKDPDARRQVRSQAMRDFRRRQRKLQGHNYWVGAPGLGSDAESSDFTRYLAETGRLGATYPIHALPTPVNKPGVALRSLVHGSGVIESSFKTRPDAAEIAVDRLYTEAVPPLPLGTPQILRSPAVHRSQLKDEFTTLFVPTCLNDRDFQYSRFVGKDFLKASGNSATAAIDAICLLYMGGYHKDQALLYEGNRCYQHAVTTLIRDLSRRDAIYDDDLLAAVWMLHLCEPMRSADDTSKITLLHVQAVEKALLSRKQGSCLNPLGFQLLCNVRFASFSFGMVHRKSVNHAGSCWWKSVTSSQSLEDELIETMLMIPGLLEELDALLQSCAPGTGAHHEIQPMLQKFMSMEARLDSWHARWKRTLDGEPFDYILSSAFSHQALIVQGAEDVFPVAAIFPDFATASLQITYWTGMLQIKQSIASLLEVARPKLSLSTSGQDLTETLEIYAVLICQSVAFCTHPRHGYCGVMRCLGPLYFAALFFVRKGRFSQLRWCQSVIANIQALYHFASPYGEALERTVSRGGDIAQ